MLETEYNIICPLCNSIKVNKIFNISIADAAKHIANSNIKKQNTIKDIIKDLWQQKEQGSFYTCKECNLSFAEPFIAGSANFYATAYDKPNYYTTWKWDYELSFEKLKELNVKENDHLLEIGAGNGAFSIKVAQKLINKDNIICTEYSELGKENINKNGIKCFSKDIKELDSKTFNHRYKYICFFQVLEHLDEYKNFFDKINSLTQQESFLMITVPNDENRKLYMKQGVFLDIPPTHLTIWNEKSFQLLAKKIGWEIIEHQKQIFTIKKSVINFLDRKWKDNEKIISRLTLLTYETNNKYFKMLVFIILGVRYLSKTVQFIVNRPGVSQWYLLKKL